GGWFAADRRAGTSDADLTPRWGGGGGRRGCSTSKCRDRTIQGGCCACCHQRSATRRARRASSGACRGGRGVGLEWDQDRRSHSFPCLPLTLDGNDTGGF